MSTENGDRHHFPGAAENGVCPHFPSAVHLVGAAPRYPTGPGDDDLDRALDRLFSAWDRDPANPFRGWVAPGGRVTIKPNWVRDFHPDGAGLECLVTHGSLVARVLDRVAVALEGRGTVVVGDAPLQDCDFARLRQATGIDAAVAACAARHPGLDVRVEDWRLTVLSRPAADRGWDWSSEQGAAEGADPSRYRLVDRGDDSFLADLDDYADGFRVTCYDRRKLRPHHGPGRHEYLVHRSALECDLFVNLPKWKTHTKAGITGALKNLVGINGHKEFLPHHVKGAFFAGGDDHDRDHPLRRLFDDLYDDTWERYAALSPGARKARGLALTALWRAARLTGADRIDAGNWSGNDTTWRTTLDLNHVLLAGPDAPRAVTIVDGIVAGEGDGPLRPRPKAAGILAGGENPAYLDAALARLAGYNLARVPVVFHAIHDRRSCLAGPPLASASATWAPAGEDGRTVRILDLPDLGFRKPRFWERAGREAGR